MKNLILLSFLLLGIAGHSQSSIKKLLKKYNEESVPYISVDELAMPKTDAILLDAREVSEFNVSHLEDAICVGYDEFNLETTTALLPDKSATIVVYCSLGIRSEDVAEQLKNAGYTNVFNLFGGIFEWKNNDFTIYNTEGETDDVHAFSKEWSKWLTKGNKIYDKLENDE
ncbi:rhodanese-like domain-containing protein [Winogradskyella eckloniae]|uniref:rhodanese-like domain-containing protein n=1 Tax=Winogradskyella eckloniae TaxID=1089306 RepID=UPI00156345F2|nr:rhodanese-like domain-containing protein [Winogradskyella eckloniae]NRD19287.1 rhodanese-like domain-containing protein [Winogradskyella eckloniae]